MNEKCTVFSAQKYKAFSERTNIHRLKLRVYLGSRTSTKKPRNNMKSTDKGRKRRV